MLNPDYNVLKLCKSVMNPKIDSNSIESLKNVYRLCIDELGIEDNIFFEYLEEIMSGYGFNTGTRKNHIYETLEGRILFIETFTKGFLLKEYEKKHTSIEELSNEVAFSLCTLTISLSSCLKIVERYKKFLPMSKRTKSFQEKYPQLNAAIKYYIETKEETLSEQKTDYFKLNDNNGMAQVFTNLPLVTSGVVRENGKITVKHNFNNGYLKINTESKNDLIKAFQEANEIAGQDSQIVLAYILANAFNTPEELQDGKTHTVSIDVKEFCKITNTRYSKRVTQKISDTVDKLSQIYVDFDYTIYKSDPNKPKQNKKIRVDAHLKESPLVVRSGTIEYSSKQKKYETDKINVVVGDWINTLSYEQYQYINNSFFTLKTNSKDRVTRSIWYYLSNMYRTKRKEKSEEMKLKVSNFIKFLNVDEERIKSKGYTETLKKPLEAALNKTDFEWKYKNGNHKSRKDFEEDFLIFTNKALNNFYIEKGI